LVSERSTETIVARKFCPDLPVFHKPNPYNNNITNDERPRDLRVAFIGDSVTRFQFVALLHYLHTGAHVPEPDEQFLNLLSPQGHGTHAQLANFTYHFFSGAQYNDFYRPNRGKTPWLYFDNRYYRDACRGNYLLFSARYGDTLTQGHWNTSQVWLDGVTVPVSTADGDNRVITVAELARERAASFHLQIPALWRFDWVDLIRDMASITPRPRYLVFNSGIWPGALEADRVFKIQAVLKETGIIGIFKTTTKARDQTSILLSEVDALACDAMPLCLDLSWTAHSNTTDYVDNFHFWGHANRQFNEQLLELLHGVDMLGLEVVSTRQRMERQERQRLAEEHLELVRNEIRREQALLDILRNESALLSSTNHS
jgi:hypothetical protein